MFLFTANVENMGLFSSQWPKGAVVIIDCSAVFQLISVFVNLIKLRALYQGMHSCLFAFVDSFPCGCCHVQDEQEQFALSW